MFRAMLACVGMLLFAVPAPASTIVTFGETGTNEMLAVDNGNGTTTLSTSSTVSITNIILGATDPAALLTFTATSTDDAQLLLGGTVISQRYAGTFDLTDATGTFSYLSGTFGAALEFGGTGSTGAILTANSSPQSPPLVLDTDFALVLTNPESFSLAFSNIVPPLSVNTYDVLGVSHTTVASFTASYAGSADAEVQAVPEPASLVLLGTGLVGLVSLRGRRMTV